MYYYRKKILNAIDSNLSLCDILALKYSKNNEKSKIIISDLTKNANSDFV